MNKVKLADVKIGDVFKINDIEFIKMSEKDGVVEAVTKNIVFKSEFGTDNNFANSTVLKKLTTEFLPKLIDIVGEENIVEFETDLTTLDGLKPYPKMLSKVSLPTFDFYRKNVEIFDKHKVNSWWWLATADSAKPHYEPVWVVCVSPRGDFDNGNCGNDYIGVRPFLNFVSEIFVSFEE